jgi:hypothetical protein
VAKWKNKEEYERWKAEKAKEFKKKQKVIAQSKIERLPRIYGIKEYIAFASVIIIFIGVFLPFLKVPVWGTLNYFQNGKGDGAILIVFAIGTFLFTLANKMKWLWITGAGSALTLVFTLYNMHNIFQKIESEMATSAKENLFSGIIDSMIQSIELQVGLPVLVLGICLTFLSAFLNTKEIEKTAPA